MEKSLTTSDSSLCCQNQTLECNKKNSKLLKQVSQTNLISKLISLPTQPSSLPSSSFYKRHLPACCIAFHTHKGKELFKQALNEQHLESFFTLSLQFLTQSEPAYCGLSTLCMCLNAFEVGEGVFFNLFLFFTI